MTKNPPRIDPDNLLTPQQRAVMFQLSTGKNVGEVAAALGLALSTVKHHKYLARLKLGPEGYRRAVYRNG